MKLNSMARMSEIERTVKNSWFGPPRANSERSGRKQAKQETKKIVRKNTQEQQASINKTHGRVHVKPIAKQMEHQAYGSEESANKR